MSLDSHLLQNNIGTMCNCSGQVQELITICITKYNQLINAEQHSLVALQMIL